MHVITRLNWHQTISNLLSKHGMQYCLTGNAKENIGNAFLGKAKDMYHQDAFSDITNSESKLRTYGLIKHDIGREHYLVQIKNTRRRHKLTKLRLSYHKLMVEVGRHMKPKQPVEQRNCQICQLETEDETHLLVKCKFYDALRKPLFEQCTELRPQFPYYSATEKFVYLMSTPLLIDPVSKFLDNALKNREIHLDVKETLERILTQVSV